MAAEGREPDVLVNLTNDGWFWGSSELDMHLACGVFRAVECRKPLLIAANTGFSAWIDGDGRIQEQGPRRAAGVIVAEPRLDRPPQLVSGPRRLVCRRVSGGVRVVRVGGDFGRIRCMAAERQASPLSECGGAPPTEVLAPSPQVSHTSRFTPLLVDMGNWAKLYYKDDVAASARRVVCRPDYPSGRLSMNLVGKIFVVLILVMSVLFMAFAMAVYATHKNWREVVNEQARRTVGLQANWRTAKTEQQGPDRPERRS